MAPVCIDLHGAGVFIRLAGHLDDLRLGERAHNFDVSTLPTVNKRKHVSSSLDTKFMGEMAKQTYVNTLLLTCVEDSC